MKKFYFLLLLLCFACSSPVKEKTYLIGIDKSFASLALEGQESNVLGFSLDLLGAIAKERELSLERIDENPLSLLPSLSRGETQGALYVMEPYQFLEKTYAYSNLYLETGPVLVMRKASSGIKLNELNNKEIAVLEGSNDGLLLSQSPAVIIRSYSLVSEVLLAIADGSLDGALIDFLLAERYISDLYKRQLIILTPPLLQKGLRLICMRKEGEPLVREFNKGLSTLKKEGKYKDLLKKWQLPY